MHMLWVPVCACGGAVRNARWGKGEKISCHPCPSVDLTMSRRLSYLAGRTGAPRGLDFEEIAAKLLSRAHHSFLCGVSGEGQRLQDAEREEPHKMVPTCGVLWSPPFLGLSSGGDY